MEKKFIFILPEFKDGGGNRWSVSLANYLSNDYDVKLFALKKNKNKTIHRLKKSVDKYFFEFKNNNFLTRIFLYLKIFLVLRKKAYNDYVFIITDPIISIFSILLYPKKIIRNVAADENNLYNGFKIFQYLGLLYIYKLLLKLSFFYPNTKFFFISKYVFVKTPTNFRKIFFKKNNEINNYFIPPSIEDKYLEINNENYKFNQKIRTVCLFPRKQNFKGLKIFNNIEFQFKLKKLGITNLILITNENIKFDKIIHQKIIIINPKNDLDIIQSLDKCDLFISTSENEGFSLPPVEAMARKKPVIMANAGGNLSYAINGYNCLLYENNEVDEIISKIEIIINNQKIREYIIKNAYETSKQYSSINLNKKWKERILNLETELDQSIDKNIEINKLRNQVLSLFNKYLLIIKSLDRRMIYNLGYELSLFPFIVIINYLRFNLNISYKKNKINYRKRLKREEEIKLCFQDWSNYKNTRYKLLKNLIWYKCGLENFNELFKTNKFKIKKYIFISGDNNEKLEYFNKKKDVEIINSNNDYYDFSSYSLFYEMNKNKNKILIFCNSSISSEKIDNFLDGYLDYFKENKNLGMLGISGNSKNHQSLIFNNFTPHIQTIFFITTVEVLNKVVQINNNIFPGTDATKFNKYSIIQKGEIILSKKVLDLGYEIGIVKPDGNIFRFSKDSKYKMFKNWKSNYKLGDARLHNILPSHPFRIVKG